MEFYDRYIDLLLLYNKTHRLSGVKNKEDVKKHIEDSIYPSRFFDFKKVKKALDVGTGAGFPGLILAMKYPHIEYSLVEPLKKRVAFLHLIKSEYDLFNITIIQDRVESIKDQKIDLITSRAVTKSDTLLTLCQNIIDKNTKFILYKGSSIQSDLPSNYPYQIYNRGDRNYLLINFE